MNTKHPLQIYLDTHDQVLLDQLATRLHLSKAETLRAALRRWALESSGGADPVLALIGILDDPEVPADLSAQPEAYTDSYTPPSRPSRPSRPKRAR